MGSFSLVPSLVSGQHGRNAEGNVFGAPILVHKQYASNSRIPFSDTSSLRIVIQSDCLSTESSAAWKWVKHTAVGCWNLYRCPRIRFSVKIWSAEPLPRRKPHWVMCWYYPSSKKTTAMSLAARSMSLISLQFVHIILSLFFGIRSRRDFAQSLGEAWQSQIRRNGLVSGLSRAENQDLKISDEMSFLPGDFFFLIF